MLIKPIVAGLASLLIVSTSVAQNISRGGDKTGVPEVTPDFAVKSAIAGKKAATAAGVPRSTESSPPSPAQASQGDATQSTDANAGTRGTGSTAPARSSDANGRRDGTTTGAAKLPASAEHRTLGSVNSGGVTGNGLQNGRGGQR